MMNTFEYATLWKYAWHRYLRSFMRLCFPQVERAIDWSRPPEFLDKELQQIVHEAEAGKQFVDLLVKVWLWDGTEQWILLHVEMQNRPDPGFEARLYRYYCRAMDIYGRPVITLAVLADTDPHWRPTHFEVAVPGTRVRFSFSICKLLDLVADEGALEDSREPAAIVVLANRAAQESSKDPERRLAAKWMVMRRLYGMGLDKADTLELFRLVDWLVQLPTELEMRFRQQVYEFELGFKQGYVIGSRQNILDLLEARFEGVPDDIRERVARETSLDRLKQWFRQAATCPRLEDLKWQS